MMSPDPRIEGPESYDAWLAGAVEDDRIRRLVTALCVIAVVAIVAIVATAVSLSGRLG